MNPFDILIVDEASQMKPADLALGMSILGEGKRLALAGDDLQLPPIISGDYPETKDGLPGLYDSIFSYLRHRDYAKNPKYTCQLLENWRMNETLSSFSSMTLYGDGYKPAGVFEAALEVVEYVLGCVDFKGAGFHLCSKREEGSFGLRVLCSRVGFGIPEAVPLLCKQPFLEETK